MMDDVEATRLCAEAIGIRVRLNSGDVWSIPFRNKENDPRLSETTHLSLYDPLHDDAQAMTLVKRFNLGCLFTAKKTWIVGPCGRYQIGETTEGDDADLNRAIVYCVAKMQAAK